MSHLSAEDVALRVLDHIFEAIARDEKLFNGYVLKGGLALRLLYGSPRHSSDLDFNAASPAANAITDETSRTLLDFCRRLDAALRAPTPVNAIEQIETADIKLSSEIPALLGQLAYTTREGWSGAIPMQVTLSEIVCASEVRTLRGVPVHVASLEDIVAEKLKALLQQVPRDTVRSSDVFDVWYFTTRAESKVRPEDVTAVLLEKRKQWPGMEQLSKSRFRADDVIAYSEAEYDELVDRLEPAVEFVSFQEAYGGILAFVNQLDLAD